MAALSSTYCLTGRSVSAAFETYTAASGMTESGVRRVKAAFLSGCESDPAIFAKGFCFYTTRHTKIACNVRQYAVH